jgi:acetyl esterase/lipase
MEVGMALEKLAWPQPPTPSFIRKMKTSLSPKFGEVELYFYVPSDYLNSNSQHRYPVVIGYHGGGWTIGRATDDARWAAAVLQHSRAIYVGVNYRLAPEYPFPVGNDDAADAILWLAQNADELKIDPSKIVLSGFSAGGGLSITAPMRLQDHLNTIITGSNSSPEHLPTVVGIIAFYPVTDFTIGRAEKRSANKRPDMSLSPIFTELFYESYLDPQDATPLTDPLLSPGLASREQLESLPDHIHIIACEYDDLMPEAHRFAERMQGELGKSVIYRLVPGVPHAWDKSPNPLQVQPMVNEVYEEALAAMQAMLDQLE